MDFTSKNKTFPLVKSVLNYKEYMNLVIHTDGGSRGNPGPAACAFVIESEIDLIKESSVFLGVSTNNVAEYRGVLESLNWLVHNKLPDLKQITYVLDSELVVKQIKGIYKVKDLNLQKIHKEILEKIQTLKVEIIFTNVPRNLNKRADFLVNQELDKSI